MRMPRLYDDFVTRLRDCAARFQDRSGLANLAMGDKLRIAANPDRYFLMVWSEGAGIYLEPFAGWTRQCGLLVDATNPQFLWTFQDVGPWVQKSFLIEAAGNVCVRVTESSLLRGGEQTGPALSVPVFGSYCNEWQATAQTYRITGGGGTGDFTVMNGSFTLPNVANCNWNATAGRENRDLSGSLGQFMTVSTPMAATGEWQAVVGDPTVPFVLPLTAVFGAGTPQQNITVEPL